MTRFKPRLEVPNLGLTRAQDLRPLKRLFGFDAPKRARRDQLGVNACVIKAVNFTELRTRQAAQALWGSSQASLPSSVQAARRRDGLKRASANTSYGGINTDLEATVIDICCGDLGEPRTPRSVLKR